VGEEVEGLVISSTRGPANGRTQQMRRILAQLSAYPRIFRDPLAHVGKNGVIDGHSQTGCDKPSPEEGKEEQPR